jgi:hypothetical protein
MGKKIRIRIRDEHNPDHISESLETIFGVLTFFDADPGWKNFASRMEKIKIRDKHPGSATMTVAEAT